MLFLFVLKFHGIGNETTCSFPNAQFVIEGYSPPFRYDRNSNGGGILLFAREDKIR